MLGNRLNIVVDFTNGTWNTVATHELFKVTGCVWYIMMPMCLATVTESVGGDPTICLGVAGETDLHLTDIVATTIEIGEMWLDDPPKAAYDENIDEIKGISNGIDIGYELKVGALDGGEIDFVLWWIPHEPDAWVEVGAGGVL